MSKDEKINKKDTFFKEYDEQVQNIQCRHLRLLTPHLSTKELRALLWKRFHAELPIVANLISFQQERNFYELKQKESI